MSPQAPARRVFLIAAGCLFLAACASHSPVIGPSTGPIVDTRTGASISSQELARRAVDARFVLLGEAHDNAIHHELQRQILEAILRSGRRPSLAMEQFDSEHQTSLDRARSGGARDPESVAEAGHFNRKGWDWAFYRPLVDLATKFDVPILAANLSREEARSVMKSGRPVKGMDTALPLMRESLEQDIIDGHCGHRPPAPMLAGMVEAQRARDARMGQILERAGEQGAVLIAGAGHVRLNRGAPAYLGHVGPSRVLSIAFVEVDAEGSRSPSGFAGTYDVVWFTPRARRADPCKDFALPAK